MKVIAISRYATSGKDLLFDLLREQNLQFKAYAFADRLKQKVAPWIKEIFGWDVFALDKNQKREVEIIKRLPNISTTENLIKQQ